MIQRCFMEDWTTYRLTGATLSGMAENGERE